MLYTNRVLIAVVLTLCAMGCKPSEKKQKDAGVPEKLVAVGDLKSKVDAYASVKLTADLSALSENDKKCLSLLIQAAQIMDDLYWQQAWGDKSVLLDKASDPAVKKYLEINYGPWDRLDNDTPFLEGFPAKPATAQFYPADMTEDEFKALENPDKDSPYTILRRNSNGKLEVIWYHDAYKTQLTEAARLLREAAELTSNTELKTYLSLRADALETDRFTASDEAWMAMKTSPIDLVIGPIENYEDGLFNKKTAYEGYVLIKDMEWSAKLAKYAAFLPALQKNLPVKDVYKTEVPASGSDLNAYDVVYYAGDCNAGGKTIAINLPNDEQFQLQFGTRRLQLKNAIRAKYEKIMVPVADVLIHPDQRKYITFDAFFANVMFHEVAHGLGIKNTINGKGSVSAALENTQSFIEEGKADILGLYMITQLHEMGELEGGLEDYYVTFMAGIFRSIRFGAASDHGKANMIRFNYFSEQGAFQRNAEGYYQVDMVKMKTCIASLSEILLTIQGDGDKVRAEKLLQEKGTISKQLQQDLDRVNAAKIPLDIVFEQGATVLGL